MKKVALLIDGGHLRVAAQKSSYKYSNDLVETVAKSCIDSTHEELYRILYYDCTPYKGTVKLPVTGQQADLSKTDSWVDDLAKRPMFAVRLGVLKFRGWKPKRIPVAHRPLEDSDFAPDFEQKGVDMRIGLDISILASNRSVERVILLTADTDFIPAMKHDRREGLQIVAVRLPGVTLTREFLAHVDIEREVPLPPVMAPGAAR